MLETLLPLAAPPQPPRSTKELNNFIRISVGLPEHTDKLLAALATMA